MSRRIVAPSDRGRRARTSRSVASGGCPCAIAVGAVLATVGPQAGGDRERPAGLAVAAELLERASEAEMGVIVGRPRVGEHAELLGGFAIALTVEQRATERLTDRRLVGLEVASARKGHRRRRVVAAFEQVASALEKVVDLEFAHALTLRDGAVQVSVSGRPNALRKRS